MEIEALLPFLGGVGALIGSLALLVTKVTQAVRELRTLRATLRKKITIVGIVHAAIPEPLRRCPDFSDIRKAVMSEAPLVVLHCRSLSYALRTCDWVCTEIGCDPKIHLPDDCFWSELN